MWDLETIRAINAEHRTPRLGIFEIREGVYAFGYRGRRALAVVARTGHGQYRGVRGRRPEIDRGAKRLDKASISDALATALNRIAAGQV